MDTREQSIAFAQAFCASDLPRLRELLAPDLRLRGPLFSFDSRDDYMRSLQADPPEPGTCTIVQAHGTHQEAAILYEYGKRGASVLVAQFNRFSGRLISEIRLVFDTGSLAATDSVG